MWGFLYRDNQIAKPKIMKIPGVLQRGMWQFDCTDRKFTPAVAQLDNGNQYRLGELQQLINDKQALLKGRKAAMEFKTTAEAD